MSTRWNEWLASAAQRRDHLGLRRTLQPRQPGESLIDLAGNDYLGLSTHPDVVAAAADAARVWGAGAKASRLVTGTTTLHADLEGSLAAAMGQPAALVFSSGYTANVGVVTALADADTLIVSDAHVHASLIDGCRLTKATVKVTPHGEVAAVREALADHDGRALVLTESIFSVLGDAAPLAELAAVCREFDALLVVDEAHGLGVRGAGAGLVSEVGLAGDPHVIVTATLSKSLGAQGGAVLGQQPLLDHLVNTARSFIFDTGLAPSATAAAAAALGLMTPDRIERLHRRRDAVSSRLEVTAPAGAVVSVPMPTPQAALSTQADCLNAGVRVGCFRPPSVPDGVSRIRITVNAGVPDDQWDEAIDIVDKAVGAHR